MCVFGTDFCLKRIFFDVAVYVCTQDREKICFRRKDVQMVEMRRIELLTPCLQGRCSPSWATPPFFKCHRFLPDHLNVIFRRLYRLPPDHSLFVSFAPHAFLLHSKALFHRETQLRNLTLSSKVLLVGLSGLEPPTSRLSGVRSNRLSYKPSNLAATCSPIPSPV